MLYEDETYLDEKKTPVTAPKHVREVVVMW